MTGFNKKGNAMLEGFVIMILIIAAIFGFIIIGTALKPVYAGIAADTTLSNTTRTIVEERETNSMTTFDNMIVMIFIALWLFALFSASKIDANPVYFIIAIILLAIFGLLVVLVGGSFADPLNSSGFADAVSEMPMSTFIVNNLLGLYIAIAISVAVMFFAKQRLFQYEV